MDPHALLKDEVRSLGYDIGDFISVTYMVPSNKADSMAPVHLLGVQIYDGDLNPIAIRKNWIAIAHAYDAETGHFAITKLNTRYVVEISATYVSEEDRQGES